MTTPSHASISGNLIKKAVNFDAPEVAVITLQRALVEATLAIAQEKRTANLIAYAVLGTYPIPEHLRAEIETALGVTT